MGSMDLRKKKSMATLCYPIQNHQTLLGVKTQKIGVGLWNGWGGGVEGNETPLECIVREFAQESSLVGLPEDFKYSGVILFHNQKPDGRQFDVEVHLYTIRKWTGVLKPNTEMKDPTWWDIGRLPFAEMMPSDKEWLPLVLRGKKIRGEVWHGPDMKTLARPSKIERLVV